MKILARLGAGLCGLGLLLYLWAPGLATPMGGDYFGSTRPDPDTLAVLIYTSYVLAGIGAGALITSTVLWFRAKKSN
jgi:hypothetical protein